MKFWQHRENSEIFFCQYHENSKKICADFMIIAKNCEICQQHENTQKYSKFCQLHKNNQKS